jgi:hypothetical protein
MVIMRIFDDHPSADLPKRSSNTTGEEIYKKTINLMLYLS